MAGAAQTSAMRLSLNDRVYNMHTGQDTTERCEQIGGGPGTHALGLQWSTHLGGVGRDLSECQKGVQ